MYVWHATPKAHTFWHCAFHTHPYQVPRGTCGAIFLVQRGVRLACHTKMALLGGFVRFKHTQTRCAKTLCWVILVQGCARSVRRTKIARLGIAHFKHTHTRCPETPSVAFLVQGRARSARHTKKPYFLPLCIPSIPALRIQRPFGWQLWSRGMRARRATPEISLIGIVQSSFGAPAYRL